MTDKSIIRLCEMCFKPTQDDECIHYPDQLNDRPIVKYRVIEFISLAAIKSLISAEIARIKRFIKESELNKFNLPIEYGKIDVLKSILTHLEEMERK